MVTMVNAANDYNLLELQSHFGEYPLKFQVVCPQIGTAVLLEPQSRFDNFKNRRPVLGANQSNSK